MDSDITGQIIILALLILGSAYFSATETAFSSFNRIRMKNLASDGNKRARLALKLADNYDQLIAAILIGNNIVNIAASSLATVLFVKYFGDYGVTLSTIVMTVLVLIFGEISPKSIAKDSPENFSMFSAPTINVVTKILYPANFLFTMWKKLLSKIFKVNAETGITEEELLTMVEEAKSDGEIDEHEEELIRNAIEFNDIEAIDIHTNRVDVVGVEENFTKEQITEVFLESGYSRLPVYSGTIDNIVGIINQKDFYKIATDTTPLKSIISKPVFVIPSMKISQLLNLLQKNKSHIAVITDEYGGTVGIVTMEDILEELVGEIWDEHDEVIEEFEEIGENEYKVLCSADLEDMFEKFEIDEELDIPTVSGWVIETFGRIPNVGESFDYKNLNVLVTKCDSRHVLEVTVFIKPKETEEEDD